MFESQMGDANEEERMSLGASLHLSGMDSIQIPFFYIADLLNIILGGMESYLLNTAKEQASIHQYKELKIDPTMKAAEINTLKKSASEFKKFRLVMGPLEIVDHSDNRPYYVNFGDVPISVKFFSEWLTSKLNKKNQAIYPLTQFLKDLFNDLLRNFLNDDTCYPFPTKQKVRLYESVITSYPAKKGRDEMTQFILGSGNKYNRLQVSKLPAMQPLLNIKGNSNYDSPNPGTQKK